MRLLEHEGEPTGLLDLWDGVDAAVVVDAVCGAGAPGSVHRLDASSGRLPAVLEASSTHSFGLTEAIELGRELGRAPKRLVVIAIEGRNFEAGSRLSPEVDRAIATAAAAAVLAELRRGPG